jgi:small subunit ribosomal protein S6
MCLTGTGRTELAENLYEGMFLFDSGKFASNPDGLAGELMGILERVGATVVAHRPWQDGKLTYAIEGRRKGLHYLVYFKMGGAGANELNRLCRLNDNVLRHMVIKHPQVLFDAMVAALEASDSQSEAPEAEAASSKSKDASSEDKSKSSEDKSKPVAEAAAD